MNNGVVQCSAARTHVRSLDVERKWPVRDAPSPSWPHGAAWDFVKHTALLLYPPPQTTNAPCAARCPPACQPDMWDALVADVHWRIVAAYNAAQNLPADHVPTFGEVLRQPPELLACSMKVKHTARMVYHCTACTAVGSVQLITN